MSVNTPSIVPIPRGTKVQSAPGPGELQQTFETVEDVTARVAWNTIRARRTQRQQLGIESRGGVAVVTWRRLDGTRPTARWLWLATVTSNLAPGDWLVVEVGAGNLEPSDPVSQQVTAGVAPVRVRSVTVDAEAGLTRVQTLQASPDGPAAFAVPPRAAGAVTASPLPLPAAVVRQQIVERTWTEPALAAQLAAQRWDAERLDAQVDAILGQAPPPATVSVLRQTAAVFGATAPPYGTLSREQLAVYTSDWDTSPPSIWETSTRIQRTGADVFLDRVVDGLVPGGWVLLSQPDTADALFQIEAVTAASLSDFVTSAKCTGLSLKTAAGAPVDTAYKQGAEGSKWKLRTTTVRLLSQSLPIGAAPVADPIGPATARIITDRMVLGLRAGQVVAVSGEAIDAGSASLGLRTELATIDRVEHSGGLSLIYLEEPLAHRYGRAGFAVCANLARATHGETVLDEHLGSTDGSSHQSRALLRAPLTRVAAPTASGTTSTLTVRIGGAAWREVPTLLEAGPRDPVYQTRTDDDGKTTIVFGDGIHGARPPTGRDNLTATYRTGMGLAGNVGARKLTLLASRPLGLRGVVNPEPATGAEGPEPAPAARRNAPLTVRTLDRIVSLTDYEDFARGFAGIARARGVEVWDGHGRLIHLTVAAADGAPVDPPSELYRNLVAAIRRHSDGTERFIVSGHASRHFALEATLVLQRDLRATDVLPAAQAAAEAAYGFAERQLAQPVTEAEVIARLSRLRGVAAVRVTRLHRLDRAVGVDAVIPASDARWNAATHAVEPAELLTLLPPNLRLTGVSP
jgi:hypothetical protein